MSDYDDYNGQVQRFNEQVQRFRELLTAPNDVMNDLTATDLDSWTELKRRLPLEQPSANNLLKLRHTTEELKRIGDTLIRILVKYE
jgi:hypothetical protein